MVSECASANAAIVITTSRVVARRLPRGSQSFPTRISPAASSTATTNRMSSIRTVKRQNPIRRNSKNTSVAWNCLTWMVVPRASARITPMLVMRESTMM